MLQSLLLHSGVIKKGCVTDSSNRVAEDYDDWSSLFHEAGHMERWAHTSPTLTVAGGRLSGRLAAPPPRDHFRSAEPSIVFCAVPAIWIFRGFGCSGFATCSSSTPFLYSALIESSETPCGSAIVREKVP
jgi:hypothetical protein